MSCGSEKWFRTSDGNSECFHDLIFVEVLELDGNFGSLLDLMVSSLVCVNVHSTFEIDAVCFMSFSTDIFDR